MYRILILCRDESIKSHFESSLKNEDIIIIHTYDTFEAEIICRSIRIDFFIITSFESYSNIILIKELKNNFLYRYTPTAVLSNVKDISDDIKGLKMCFNICLPLKNTSTSKVFELVYHDLTIKRESLMNNSFITLNNSSDFIRLKTDSVIFIEAEGRKCHIYTTNNDFYVSFTLKEIEKSVEGTSLYRCHRSYIVNTSHILKIDKSNATWEIYFYGIRKTALVSRQNKREFSCLLNNLKTI